jgi:zinc-finger of transposase IS204/IS1001/IS1096/IS1165
LGSPRFLVHLDGLGVVASPYRAGEIPSSFRTELIRHLLPLIPADLLVEQVLPEPDRVVILSRPRSPVSTCPLCGVASGRVHSHYLRTLADLPWQGRLVALRVQARRFRCATRDGLLERAPPSFHLGTAAPAPPTPSARHRSAAQGRMTCRMNHLAWISHHGRCAASLVREFASRFSILPSRGGRESSARHKNTLSFVT